MHNRSSLMHWLWLAAAIAATSAAYGPGLYGSFIFDDIQNIVLNENLRLFDGTPASLVQASSSALASAIGRPLSMATFALNLHFGGLDPFYFKLTNLIIHLANGVLIFSLARTLLSAIGNNLRAPLAAVWVAALWLLHPINLVPVLLVVQRMTGLAALLTLSALCLYLYARKSSGHARRAAFATIAVLLWPAAILAKETGILLPFYILLIEWLVFRSIPTLRIRSKIAIGIIAAIAIGSLFFFMGEPVLRGYEFRQFSLIERLLTESRVLLFYLMQLLAPWPEFFSLYHDDFQISRGVLSPPSTLAAITVWGAIVACAWWMRQRFPLPAFAVAWFLLAHSIESSVLPLEIAHEHRNYLASFGLWLWLAAWLFSGSGKSRVAKRTLACSFMLFCALVTGMRAHQWADEYRRLQLETMVHPDSARANLEAARAIMQRTFISGGGNSISYHMAKFHFNRAAALDTTDKAALLGALYLDCSAKAPRNPDLLSALTQRFATAPLSPVDRSVIQSLSALFVERRLCLNDDEVLAVIQAGLSNPAANRLTQGMLYSVAMDYAVAGMGSLPKGLFYAQAAVSRAPGDASFRINLIRLLLAAGKPAQAAQEYAALGKLRIPARYRMTVAQLGSEIQGAKTHAPIH